MWGGKLLGSNAPALKKRLGSLLGFVEGLFLCVSASSVFPRPPINVFLQPLVLSTVFEIALLLPAAFGFIL